MTRSAKTSPFGNRRDLAHPYNQASRPLPARPARESSSGGQGGLSTTAKGKGAYIEVMAGLCANRLGYGNRVGMVDAATGAMRNKMALRPICSPPKKAHDPRGNRACGTGSRRSRRFFDLEGVLLQLRLGGV